MKFMHLADLHIGKIVNGFSMLEDQIFILDQIVQYVREYKPHAVVMAGDIYDRPVPNTEAVKVFDQFLTDLARENTVVLIINGNHDSPERLGFASRIMYDRNIYLYGTLDGQMRKIPVEDEHGRVFFHLLPFIKPSIVRPFYTDTEIENSNDAVKAVIDAAELDKNSRNVLVAHQFVISTGSEPERSESEIGPVGGIDSIDADMLKDFDYVALGHLHGPQKIGFDHIRYAGSPLKYSFSECHHKKSVTLVELEEKGSMEITRLPLKVRRDMRKIKGPIAELMSDSIVAQGAPEDYLHITLTDEDEIFDAIGKIRSVYPNVMLLSFENARTEAISDFSEISPNDSIAPSELFGSFFLAQNGAEMSPEQAAAANALLEQIGGEV